MARQSIYISDAWECSANGSYRLYLMADRDRNLTVSAIWANDEVPPGGRALVTLDGQSTENGLWDLATERSWVANGYPAYLDVTVSALPQRGRITFYFR